MLDLTEKSKPNHYRQVQYIRELSLYSNHSTAGNHPLHYADNRKKRNPQNVPNLQRHTKKKISSFNISSISLHNSMFLQTCKILKNLLHKLYVSVLYNEVHFASSRNPFTPLTDLAELAALTQTIH
jgi:hypothetical protein